jgi:hypothetical protein
LSEFVGGLFEPVEILKTVPIIQTSINLPLMINDDEDVDVDDGDHK